MALFVWLEEGKDVRIRGKGDQGYTRLGKLFDEAPDQVHIISRKNARTVNRDCFFYDISAT